MNGIEEVLKQVRKAILKIDDDDPSSEELRGYFWQVFESVDAHPRPVRLKVVTRNSRTKDVEVDFDAEGRPVFRVGDRTPAVGETFGGRWLPEHPVPLKFNRRGVTWLRLEPTSGHRVKVRRLNALAAFLLRFL